VTSDLYAVSLDTRDPAAMARFYAGLTGWHEVPDPDPGAFSLLPEGGTGFRLRFLPADTPKLDQNWAHWDMPTSSPEDMAATVQRALDLGAQHLDIGQGPDAENVVLADPEGNELDVIEPGNNFLANTGFLGCLASDGTQAVGYFWSAALGWPLVWDQDEETAIQPPGGTGSKISWGGPPVEAKPPKHRIHLDVVPRDGDVAAEMERLLGLGATHRDIGQGEVPWTVLSDPDGNEFCVRPRD